MNSAGKILLIDDDPFFLKILSDAFIENGFTVYTAPDGVEGVRAYQEKLPDAVISDLVMPRMGGVSTCMEIRKLSAGHEPIIVMLTSMFKEEPHEHSTPEMGARYHISKSAKPLDIVILVEQLIQQARAAVSAS